MGGELVPVYVYGFKCHIVFNNPPFGIIMCSSGNPGEPVYASEMLYNLSLKDAESLSKRRMGSTMNVLESWLRDINQQYGLSYKCEWQLALSGDIGECICNCEYEDDIESESDSDSDYNPDEEEEEEEEEYNYNDFDIEE